MCAPMWLPRTERSALIDALTDGMLALTAAVNDAVLGSVPGAACWMPTLSRRRTVPNHAPCFLHRTYFGPAQLQHGGFFWSRPCINMNCAQGRVQARPCSTEAPPSSGLAEG